MIRNTNSIVFLYVDNSIVLVTIKAALDKAKYNFEFNIQFIFWQKFQSVIFVFLVKSGTKADSQLQISITLRTWQIDQITLIRNLIVHYKFIQEVLFNTNLAYPNLKRPSFIPQRRNADFFLALTLSKFRLKIRRNKFRGGKNRVNSEETLFD